ncbi:MAG: nitrous oxide reductase accessory protein NosL [Bacteroidetes bacterium]|nr:nitrous oxide reductase accessory protein NosL [Bacteroidota bacterium]
MANTALGTTISGRIKYDHLAQPFGGAFDIINGLNHYIGMRLIKDEMFPEFAYIGILIGIYIALGLITSISGKINLLKAFVITGILYGVAALYDFYRWGYDYGHNLDPHAAIQVPGMSYQPPVIGYKNLLNFTAYSGPDTGGWIIISASVVASLLLVYELIRAKKRKKAENRIIGKMAMIIMTTAFISSCSAQGPAPIQFGKDECSHCKMTLTDQKFGAEIITTTNKVYKYDDVNCLVNYLKAYPEVEKNVKTIYIVDYSNAGNFIPINEALLLYSEEIRSPMGSSIAAFSSKPDREAIQNQLPLSETTTWEKVKTSY